MVGHVGSDGRPSDFTVAYRQMPLDILHILMAGTGYYDYRQKRRRYAYYRRLPFGSSIAPAAWSEVSVALAQLMAKIFLAIILHCSDDILDIEIQRTVDTARPALSLRVVPSVLCWILRSRFPRVTGLSI